MLHHTRAILAVLLVSAATVSVAACGSSGGADAQAPAPGGSAPAVTRSATPKPTATGPSARARVHADAASMMADIKAAEKRGDVVDGIRVGTSSNPYDYVGVSPVFVKIVALGKPALPAIAAEILASPNDGLREYLLAAAGAQISGETSGEGGQTWASGREWARQYREKHE